MAEMARQRECKAAKATKEKPPVSHIRRGTVLGWTMTAVFVGAWGASFGIGHGGGNTPVVAATPRESSLANGSGLSEEDLAAFSERFDKEIWPVVQQSCLPCHGSQNASQFLLPKEPKAAFLRMLAEGHFDEDNHASAVFRMTTTDKAIVMPPPSMGELPRAQVALLEKFSEEIAARRAASKGAKPDEVFPAYLELPYTGSKPAPGLDNTFITYTQLRGKVKTIFNDDWKREDRDLFVENVHLFGGADFMQRFDESSKATPTFLTGMDLLSRDVASRAYLAKTGPFAGFPQSLPDPQTLKAPSAPMKAAVNQLYRKVLFRDATPQEQQHAFSFLQRVYKQQQNVVESSPHDLRFQLTVTDEQGMQVVRDIVVRGTFDTHGLTQEFVDQSKDAADKDNRTATKWLKGKYHFVAGDDGQKVMLDNRETHGNVSIASVTLRGPLPATTEKTLTVESVGVLPEGAWKIRKDNNFTSYEDNNENKGKSSITFPVLVDKTGDYEVAVTWRRFDASKTKGRGAPTTGAENVLVQVVSRNKESQLALPTALPVPPPGEAHFTIDQSVDNRPYADLRTAFRFGPQDGVEIRNTDTQKLVTADAVRLLPPQPERDEVKNSVILRGADAIGKKKWTPYNQQRFNAYNTVGPEIFQDSNDKGDKIPDLRLMFRPEKAAKDGFEPAKFYRVGVVYPGKADNETRVPVVVKAQASSPIVQVRHPYHTHVGATVTLDASSTFNLQRTKLTFRWTQIGGPRVTVKDPTAPVLSFVTPKMTAQQAAWEGLCRALLAHPDFLFTRPRSLATVTEAPTRKRLQLVKLAQDLLARAPTAAEVAELDKGAPLATFVDRWLQSREFQDFYFRRVRLYLESHGGDEQDEPARLWTYIMANNRPFKEILTADYTVDPDGKKKTRPPYHGKTGVLTMKGFIDGKPGLPHFNYPAQVLEKFMGYVFEVPDSVLQVRDGITAAATTDPTSVCYTCHKVLTPLAYQRLYWDDEGNYRTHDETGLPMDNSDQGMVASYPYKGRGMEAFALQAQNKERFVRTILQNHFVWYFGRELRYEADERSLYKRLWDTAAKNNYSLRPIIRSIVLSPEYLNGSVVPDNKPNQKAPKSNRIARLAQFHYYAGVKM
ncbi:MAG: hypothetical protein OHK0029_23180 [Armatimonadaceae bacterium]